MFIQILNPTIRTKFVHQAVGVTLNIPTIVDRFLCVFQMVPYDYFAVTTFVSTVQHVLGWGMVCVQRHVPTNVKTVALRKERKNSTAKISRNNNFAIMASTTLEQYTQSLLFKHASTIETKLNALNDLCSFLRKHVAKNDYKNFDYDNRHEFIADIIAEIVHTHLPDDNDDNDNLPESVICYRTCQECERADINARKIVALKRYVCNKCNGDINENLKIFDDDDETLTISKWTIIKFVTEAVLLVRCWVWGLCEKPWYILWKKKTTIDSKAL